MLSEVKEHERVARSAARRFVGRGPEIDQLTAGIADGLNGRGRIFLLTGEAGIGKTQLAREAADHAAEQGFVVLWGRCWESGGAPSFWPWVQALRGHARGAHLGGATPAVRAPGEANLPELASLVGAGTELGLHTADRDQMRFRLFDAAAGFLRRATVEQPLLLILDDLHAADVDSLLLLRFLARELADIRLLVIGTYREAEARTQPAIAEILGEVGREATTLALRGWSEREVAEFIGATVRDPPGVESRTATTLAASVCRITEGNPFFVDEIVRLWNAEGQVPEAAGHSDLTVRIPDQVRDAVRRRLGLLPTASRAVLSVAAVIGREFDVPVLADAVGADMAAGLPEALSGALTAAILAEVPGASGRYSFAHVLIRDTLYQDHPAAVRAALHKALAVAIERVHATALEAHYADLAHHYFAAASEGTADEAMAYALRAAAQATSNCAYADAVTHRQRALEAFALLTPADAAAAKQQRCELLLGLGAAQNAAGQRYEARDTFREAAELARDCRLPEAFAQAALGYGGSWDGPSEVIKFDPPDPAHFDDLLSRLLRDAREMLGDRNPALRARLLSRLAIELYFTSTPAQRDVLTQEAVTLARRLDDPLTLAAVLWDCHVAVWGPDNVNARRAMAEEIVELAERMGDYGLQLGGRAWLIADLLEVGDGHRLEVEFERFRRLAESYRQPMYLWSVKNHSAQQALLTGDYAAAEQFAQEALAIGQATFPAAFVAFSVQMAAVQRDCGRFEELGAAEVFLRGICEQYPDIPSPRVALTHLLVVTGRLEEARVEFERLAGRDFQDLARDLGWTSVMAELTEVCAAVGDTRRAAMLYRALLPCGAYVVVTPYHATCWGSVARSLGVLATMLEDWTAAEAHFAVALECNRRLGARPWVARTQFSYAAMLCQRQQRGDTEKAGPLLAEARTTAEALGMRPLLQRIAELGIPIAVAGSTADAGAASSRHDTGEVGANRFACNGEFWQIAYAGQSCSLKHTRGLNFLAQLLRAPHHEFHALDLVQGAGSSVVPDAPASQAAEAAGQGPSGGDAGSLLDPQAKAAYKQRLADLRDDLEEARARNDLGAVARAQQEIDFLTQELSRAFGLGGRDRRAASHAERARVNVTRAIAAVLKKITHEHPALGRHLTETIRTGTFCAYKPDPRVPIEWQV